MNYDNSDKKRLLIGVDDLPGIKVLYEKAVKEQQKDFIYKGHKVVVSYIKYLIQYFETK